MKTLDAREYYGKGYKGKIYNRTADLIKVVNQESWALTPDRPVPPPKPYKHVNTKHWTELNLRAFLWSLAP